MSAASTSSVASTPHRESQAHRSARPRSAKTIDLPGDHARRRGVGGDARAPHVPDGGQCQPFDDLQRGDRYGALDITVRGRHCRDALERPLLDGGDGKHGDRRRDELEQRLRRQSPAPVQYGDGLQHRHDRADGHGVTRRPRTAPTTPAPTVSIQVTFSETVTVTGTPQLALNSSGGAADYSLAAPAPRPDLHLHRRRRREQRPTSTTPATSALTLNGGTIKDAADEQRDADPRRAAAPPAPRRREEHRHRHDRADRHGVTRRPRTAPTRPVSAVSIRSTSARTSPSPARRSSPSTTGGTVNYASRLAARSTLTFTYTVGAGDNGPTSTTSAPPR